ncbi:MAG: sugar nucleotide-binding protein [Candidatus Omnitrophota bacterium]
MGNKILIFGKGYIGERLQEAFGSGISAKLIRSLEDAQKEIKKFKPGIIINCIGHTGRNVDDCELDKDRTLMANAFVPIILAEAAIRNNLKLVHISTGCIFDYNYKKDKPITEKRAPDFFGLFYSRSKIYAERALEILSQRFNILIPRLRIPLDDRPHPRNILTKLINCKRVIHLPNSVTYIPDFIKAVSHLIKTDARGIFNVVNKGALRFPDLMEAYKKYAPEFEYEVIDFKKLNLERTNLILSTRKLENSGFKVRPIKEVLEECARNYVKH